jgi:hypothetical protein
VLIACYFCYFSDYFNLVNSGKVHSIAMIPSIDRSAGINRLFWKDAVKNMRVRPAIALPERLEVTGIEIINEALTMKKVRW